MMWYCEFLQLCSYVFCLLTLLFTPYAPVTGAERDVLCVCVCGIRLVHLCLSTASVCEPPVRLRVVCGSGVSSVVVWECLCTLVKSAVSVRWCARGSGVRVGLRVVCVCVCWSCVSSVVLWERLCCVCECESLSVTDTLLCMCVSANCVAVAVYNHRFRIGVRRASGMW